MDQRTNSKEHGETFIRGRHLKLTELKREPLLRYGLRYNKYLVKEDIPLYPRPEFHVSHLRHDTNALFEIVNTGFCAPASGEQQRVPKDPHRKDLLWWSLSVQPGDMYSAEERLLRRTYPDRTEEQIAEQQMGFLKQFTTSPALEDKKRPDDAFPIACFQTIDPAHSQSGLFLWSGAQYWNRYGAYRLTFPLEDLLGEYRRQVCDGSEPVLRIFETIMYKQEVLYSVLVHKDDYNNVFNEYPLLDDSPDAVCAYRDGQIIWRPEAMSETHSYQLVPENNQLKADRYFRDEFYVWDHVTVAFHLPTLQTLNMDTNRMRENLKFCQSGRPGEPTIHPIYKFDDFEKAKKKVKDQWPDYGPFKG